MNNSIRTPIPAGVLLIAGFYLFGAIVLLVSLFTNPVGVSHSIAGAHGLPSAVEPVVLPIIAGIALLIAYGLYKRSRWGYFLTMTYLVLFGGVSFWLLSQSMQQPYIGNCTWAVSVILYLLWKRQYFFASPTWRNPA